MLGLNLLRRHRNAATARPRLVQNDGDRLYYAIGDIHGCADLLRDLHHQIIEDAGRFGREPTIILLGDLIDRGPSSAEVLDYAIGLVGRDQAVCLAGNHEVSMLDFLERPTPKASWLLQGGSETLASYGIDTTAPAKAWARRSVLDAFVPPEHVSFLHSLPISLQTRHYFFCHASPDPATPLDAQRDETLLWRKDAMRSDFVAFPLVVVHGHEAIGEPYISRHRINVDTGAYATDRLSAVRLSSAGQPALLTAGPITAPDATYV